MTETREGTDVVERAAMAHCAKAVDLGLSVTPWDGLRQVDRVDAYMCMEAATADMRAELTRLRAENEALKEALRDLLIFYGDDTEAREVLRSDFTGPEPLLMDDDALRESVWNNARAALSKALGEGQDSNG